MSPPGVLGSHLQNVCSRFSNEICSQVGAGETIGSVAAPGWCHDGHVHLSVLKLGDDGGYIDPSRHMERREMPPPKWRQECDHYILVWKVLLSRSRLY